MASSDAKLVTIGTSKGKIVIKVEGKLSPIAAGYYAKSFAWARRPLAEAGL